MCPALRLISGLILWLIPDFVPLFGWSYIYHTWVITPTQACIKILTTISTNITLVIYDKYCGNVSHVNYTLNVPHKKTADF